MPGMRFSHGYPRAPKKAFAFKGFTRHDLPDRLEIFASRRFLFLHCERLPGIGARASWTKHEAGLLTIVVSWTAQR